MSFAVSDAAEHFGTMVIVSALSRCDLIESYFFLSLVALRMRAKLSCGLEELFPFTGGQIVGTGRPNCDEGYGANSSDGGNGGITVFVRLEINLEKSLGPGL